MHIILVLPFIMRRDDIARFEYFERRRSFQRDDSCTFHDDIFRPVSGAYFGRVLRAGTSADI